MNSSVHFTSVFEEECEKIKERLKTATIEEVAGEEIDEKLISEAVEQRFEEIKHEDFAKTLPGLLPEDRRPPYRDPNWDTREDWVPKWIMAVHTAFIILIVITAHYPAIFIGLFLFFLGFAQITPHWQNRINLKSPLMVGFFLAGLVIHGGLQAWWIEPILGSLSEFPLMLGSIILTAFNDNASVTYLSTLVPGFTETMKFAVVAGAVTGGGLTIIANAPNPAGQSILRRFFTHGISPLALLKAALLPTLIVALVFLISMNIGWLIEKLM